MIRLGDSRPLAMSRAALNACEDPPSSGLYPSLAGRPFVLVTDEDQEEGQFAESYPPGSGIERTTGAVWIDNRPVWQVVYYAASMTPGTSGAALSSALPAIDKLIRIEGAGNLSNSGAGGWVPLGGSGFAITARDDGTLVVTGP